ncbi:MAG: magnesium transporter [Actinobacteria bacterium]|nr:magnesium transporter [Actinomycetota bacterium]
MITYEEYSLVKTLNKLIESKDWRQIKNILEDIPPSDFVHILEDFDEETGLLLFRLLPKEKAAKVFAELEPDRQEEILKNLGNRKIRQIILELPPDDRTEVFGDLPGNITQKLLNVLPPEERKEALSLLCYSEESVGRLMTPDYIAVKSFWTIGRALDHIREFGKDAETVDIVYVVDSKWHLIDSLPLRKFILADPEAKVESIMDRKFISIYADEDQEEAARRMKKYDLVALPVIDKDGVLMGIVTVDDILDVLEEETTEDFQKGAAIAPVGIKYSVASPLVLYLKRISWLSILLIVDFVTSTVISRYEDVLKSVIALAFFIPALIDTGGNTSTQSATLIIRALSTGELTVRKWFSVVKKEILTGLFLGISLGSIFFLRIALLRQGLLLGLTLGLTIVCIVIISNLLGAILPIILTKLRLDPAVVSSPFLTSIVDILGVLIYFSIARLIFTL